MSIYRFHELEIPSRHCILLKRVENPVYVEIQLLIKQLSYKNRMDFCNMTWPGCGMTTKIKLKYILSITYQLCNFSITIDLKSIVWLKKYTQKMFRKLVACNYKRKEDCHATGNDTTYSRGLFQTAVTYSN